MNDVEKQVSVCDCVRGLFLSSMSPMEVQVAILIETCEPFPDHSLNKQMLNGSLCCLQVCELQRSLKASQTEQQEALERATSAVTLEQKAIQDSLLQVYLHTHTHWKLYLCVDILH